MASNNTENILFIVNPISGGKDKTQIATQIEKYIESDLWDLVFTEGPNHATQLTQQGIADGYKNFIAVGGDGTVNEVGKALIGTDCNLGIIPYGSGNGLARHNHIPLQFQKAIETIKQGVTKRIDTCMLNDMPFINMSGVGFDAHIGKLFAESKGRGFGTYFTTTMQEFKNYKPQQYIVNNGGEKMDVEAFLISFANSSQYGNNAYIAPTANMEDGLLDVCIMKPFPPYQILDLGFRLFTKTIDKSAYLATFRTSELTLKREHAGVIHVDGEPFETGNEINIKVNPKSLNLIVGYLN